MNKSDDIKDLAIALCKAQSEMGGAAKDANNPFFKSKYADLGSVIRAIKEPFFNNGLSYSQLPLSQDGLVGVQTILMHSSGQWLISELLLKPVKSDPQAAGSALTYCRRYALQAMAGIPSEDDDGNAASKAAKPAPAPSPIDLAAWKDDFNKCTEPSKKSQWAGLTPEQQSFYNGNQ